MTCRRGRMAMGAADLANVQCMGVMPTALVRRNLCGTFEPSPGSSPLLSYCGALRSSSSPSMVSLALSSSLEPWLTLLPLSGGSLMLPGQREPPSPILSTEPHAHATLGEQLPKPARPPRGSTSTSRPLASASLWHKVWSISTTTVPRTVVSS